MSQTFLESLAISELRAVYRLSLNFIPKFRPIFFPWNFGHKFKSELAELATFAVNFEQLDVCRLPILAVLSTFLINSSKGMADIAPDHLGTSVNKCPFPFVNSPFVPERSA